MKLRQRVEKLEMRSSAVAPLLDLFVQFAPAGATVSASRHRAGVHSITCGQQEWCRLYDEIEEALQERAIAEAAQPAAGCVRVFLSYPTLRGDDA